MGYRRKEKNTKQDIKRKIICFLLIRITAGLLSWGLDLGRVIFLGDFKKSNSVKSDEFSEYEVGVN